MAPLPSRAPKPGKILGRGCAICPGILVSAELSADPHPPAAVEAPPAVAPVSAPSRTELFRLERLSPIEDIAVPEAGQRADMIFQVGADGISQEDLAVLVAAVERTRKAGKPQDKPDYVEAAARGPRYPEEEADRVGGCVFRCICERREAKLSRDGAVVLHVMALQSFTAGEAQLEAPLADRTQRQDVFSAWIIATLGGPEALAAGVLDIAGGKGALSNALVALGVPCTLVDPFAGYGRDPTAQGRGEGRPGTVGLLLDRAVRSLSLTVEAMEAAEPELAAGCGAVVALHPDEATESALDLAVANRRPFAVVPCCVMPALFPERSLDGAAVSKYGTFLRYLRGKDPRIRYDRLPLAGRNIVLYMTAGDFERPCPE